MDAANGNGHAARAALKLSESTLALVAKERGITLPQLLTKLTGVLLDAAEAGDTNAARDLRGYAVASWLGHGSTSSTGMLKRIRSGMRRGFLTLEEGVRATKLVQVQREMETSDLDRRLRAVEAVAGTAIRAHLGEEEEAT